MYEISFNTSNWGNWFQYTGKVDFFLAILDYVYISAKYVCKITNLNASSQIVKDAKICKIDIKIEILYFSYY